MIPICFSTSFLLFPGANRVQVSVLISLTATLAPTIGPSLRGWLTQALSWHWLLYQPAWTLTLGSNSP